MEYDAIIIGSGVAGIFAGFKLSRAGKRVLLIERQPIPGGYATVFARKGFTFESSIHCVDAMGKGADIGDFLSEYGLDQKLEFIPLKDFARLIYPGHDFVIDFDRTNLIALLKKEFPVETKGIDKIFCQFNKLFLQVDAFFHSRLPDWAKVLLAPLIYPGIVTASMCTAGEFVGKYLQDKKLKAIITDIWRFAGLPPSRLSAFYFLEILKGYYFDPAVYIKGGFIRLFKTMIQEMEESGSTVMFNTTVKKIVTKDGAVRAVIAEDGREFTARAVISNASALDTLTRLIDNDTLKEKYRKELALLENSSSAVQVYLGLDCPAKDLGMDHFMFSVNSSYDHDANFAYCRKEDYEHCPLAVVDHAQVDPGLVPQGKGSLAMMTFAYYADWRDLSDAEYKAKKADVAARLIRRMENYLPGLSAHIEVMEVATPRTMHRYSLSPDGAIYGFAQTVEQSGINRLAQETKVKGLILAGAWTMPGAGVHACFLSGVDAADLVLKILK